ncbi:von Willebrand factor A [Pelistega indica]|uniref:von Willebrand factor A n=1 Tax=Pelistega indica TaxID=1414851 RepID=V8G401_9BURK|nr:MULTISPECIES: VWA domain-containing protein [Pelistega]ETD71155.1 von Willebrand factor A [Pelistega indica]
MLLAFFFHLRQLQIPVSVKEFLTLLDALRRPIMSPTLEDFYYLARLILIKDESQFDKFDQAFALFAQKIEASISQQRKEIPIEWLIKEFQKQLTDEEKAAIEKHGWEKLLELFKQRLEEQKERHAGGNKWIGTGGTSPFGNSGYHPEGYRIGGESAGHRTAIKVWEERQFKAYDNQQEIGTRNFKLALRRLRRFARDSSSLEFDLDNTIKSTAQNAGYLDIKMIPERHNSIKVLLLLDIGGSMDDHIQLIEELFSAASSEFQHLEVYYFHNCVYEKLWRYNAQNKRDYISTWDVLNKFNADWRVIFIGDASMSVYEILQSGGSVEHYNKETGETWLNRLITAWPNYVWLNPEPERYWRYRHSNQVIQDIMHNRMYPTTVEGIENAMKILSK